MGHLQISDNLSGLMDMFGQLGGWLSPILTAYLATRFGWIHALDFAVLVTLDSSGLFMLADVNRSIEQPPRILTSQAEATGPLHFSILGLQMAVATSDLQQECKSVKKNDAIFSLG